MPTYQLPNGQTIDLPEGITLEDVLGMATPDPMQGTNMGERFMMGFGKAARDTGTGLGQIARGMLPGGMADNMGLPTRADFDRTEEEDKPLMDTGAGMLGNVLGNIAMIALPGGSAAKYGSKIPKVGQAISSLGKAITAPTGPLRSAIGGAILGVTRPVGEDDSRLENAGFGGLLGAMLPSAFKGKEPDGLRYDEKFLQELNAPRMPPMMGGSGDDLLRGVPPSLQRDTFRIAKTSGEHSGGLRGRPTYDKFAMDSPLVQEELQRMAALAETKRIMKGLLDMQLLPVVNSGEQVRRNQ